MDINNNSNITSQIANSISKLNLNTATRAFNQAQKKDDIEEVNLNEEIIKEEKSLIEGSDKSNIKNSPIDVAEVQQYANQMGENLTIEDINYGLMYGRSVIADYSV